MLYSSSFDRFYIGQTYDNSNFQLFNLSQKLKKINLSVIIQKIITFAIQFFSQY
jgi:hypothetical protein